MSKHITKNFTLEELQRSATAIRKGINNNIPADLMMNTIKLCEKVLQPIRDYWGKPIIVTSCYRCEQLNKLVGGAKYSQHLQASAADIRTVEDTLEENRKLWDTIMRMRVGNMIVARQIIWEKGNRDKGPDWIHISCNDDEHEFRVNQVIFQI